MSVNSLLFKNSLELNAQSINLSGIASGLIKVPPIITTSNLLCANLYVERALYCDQAGNIAVPSGPFTITNAPVYGYVLTGSDSTHAQWEELPVQEPAKYLMTDTGSVKIFNSDPPAPGDVLIALNGTEAAWGPQSGGGGSNVASFLDTTGAPVNVSFATPPLLNQYLKSTSATTAIWDYVTATNALYANVSGYSIESLHSQWSDDSNIALTALHANVADLSNISHFADQANWAHTANLAGFAVDSSHSDFADFANAITNTTVTPGVYGDATHVGKFTVNASGQLTQAANVAISFPGAGNLTGPVTSVGLATTITATGVTSQKYGNSTSVPSFIVNSAGQLTQAANVSISFPAAGNLSGPISSVGLATSITSQTGIGSTFVVQNTPTLTTPNIGAAIGTSLNVTGQLTSTIATGIAPIVVSSTTNVPNLYVARSSLADTVTTNANLTGPIVSVGNATSISSQTGTGTTFVVQTNPSITNPTISQITNTGVLTLPSTTDTLIGRSTTDSLTNKTLTDNSNNVLSRGLWCNSGTGSVSTYASTNPVSGYVLTATGVSTATWQAAAASGPTFPDNTFSIYDSADNTKQIQFDAAGTTATKTTITSAQTVNRVITLPDLTDTLVGRSTTDTLTNKTLTTPVISSIVNTGTLTLPTLTDTLVGRSTTDTLTNKTLTDSTNNVLSRGLWNGSGTGSVSCYAAAAPTTGQILTATSATTATWVNPGSSISPLNTLCSATILLSATDIKNMFATPISFLTVPSGSQGIAVVWSISTSTYSTAVFAGGGDVQLRWSGFASNAMAGAVMPVARMTTTSLFTYLQSGVINTGVIGTTLVVTNATAAYTGASAAGTLRITIAYFPFS